MGLLGSTLVALTLVAPNHGGYLSPAGIVAGGRTAYFVNVDNELPLWPAFFIGVRRGVGDRFDAGLEVGALDVVFVARGHGKVQLWRSDDQAWAINFRLRLEFRRQLQHFGDGTVVDDFGFDVIPEIGGGYRFGEQREHAVYYAAFYFIDIDVRPVQPVQHFVMAGMLGYEHRFESGIHLQADLAVGFELFNRDTEGIPIPRIRLVAGYDF